MNILHRLKFARGSEALEFVRTLRELSDVQLRGALAGIGPVLVYGARIVSPDGPAELYASVGALTLAHLLGMDGSGLPNLTTTAAASSIELPADMALLFTAATPDEALLPRRVEG